MSISETIKAFIKSNQSNMTDAARRLKISRQRLYKIINDDGIRLEQVQRVAAAYDHTVALSFVPIEDSEKEPI